MNAQSQRPGRALQKDIVSATCADNSTELYVCNSPVPILFNRPTLFNAFMKQTIEEIRREWLIVLIERYRTIAALNEALGRPTTDATLSQIKNQAPNTRTGAPKNMGSTLAREIEEKLGMQRGTLDHPPPAISDSDGEFVHRVEQEVARYEIPDHIRQTIMTLITSSPEKPH